MRLPVHAYAGIDCYDMVCLEGYTVFEEAGSMPKCIPNPVTMDIVWICVSIILLIVTAGILIMACVHCMNRKSASSDLMVFDQDPSAPSAPPASLVDPSPFGEEDPPTIYFQNIVTSMHLDDASAMMLEGEFSPIPLNDQTGVRPSLFTC
jgi:hypothetical protein